MTHTQYRIERSIERIERQLRAAYRALGLANKMHDSASWKGRIFKTINNLRRHKRALTKLLDA